MEEWEMKEYEVFNVLSKKKGGVLGTIKATSIGEAFNRAVAKYSKTNGRMPKVLVQVRLKE